MPQSRDPNPLNFIIHRIAELRVENPRRIIAIDGRGGAGKSSLARKIAAGFQGATHVEFDWFHLPKDQVRDNERFDIQRLMDELIKPFREGRQELVCGRYNWGYLAGRPDGLSAEPSRLRGVETLLLEGCGTLSSQLNSLYDLRVWVDTPAEEALERGMRRDIDEYGLEPARVRAAWQEWVAWEAKALACDDRSLRADVRFIGG